MTLLIINPKSGGNKTLKKWKKLSHLIPHDIVMTLDQWMNSAQRPTPDDKILSAGGDGCLHSIINTLIKNFGISVLSEISIGAIGLGSNNSYLQPFKDRLFIEGVAVQIQEPHFFRDLIEVEIEKNSIVEKKWIVSNASLGVLAFANQNFNQNFFVQILKKISMSLADIFSFILTLIQFKPVDLKIEFSPGILQSFSVTNLHWLKAPYFTKDLHFPTLASIDSGLLDFYGLTFSSKWNVLVRFVKMLFLQKMSCGYEFHRTMPSLTVISSEGTLLETDGEIVYGNKFKFTVHRQAMRCLS